MSETTDKNHKTAASDEKTTRASLKKDRRISDLEQRLKRIENRTKNNERFGKTMADCLASQVAVVDAVAAIVRRSLHDDVEIQDELSAAISYYDRHKFSRWFCGFLGFIFRILALCVAAFMGAFIYWTFSGQ